MDTHPAKPRLKGLGRFKADDSKLSPKEADMVRRTSIVYGAISFVSLLTFTSIVSTGTAMDGYYKWLLIFVGLLWITLTFVHFKRKWIMQTPYIAVLGSAVTTFVTIAMNPDSTNVFSMYYVIFLALIYMDFKLTLLTQLLALGQLLYMLFGQKDQIVLAPGAEATYLIYFLLINIIVFCILRVTSHLNKQMAASREEAESLMLQQKQQKEAILQLIGSVTGNMSAITLAAKDNTSALQEMNAAFQEIANGSNSQMESTLEINESVRSMLHLVEQMSASLGQLQEETGTTRELSDSGTRDIGLLNETFDQFNAEIEAMTSEISELIGKLSTTNAFSTTIKEIANQTSLLSLNASIEAARAGEQGMGFAVVATEIRKLSDITSNSADQITVQLQELSQQSSLTRQRMEQVSSSMGRNFGLTERTSASFSAISQAITRLNELADNNNRMMQSVEQAVNVINDSTGQLAAVSEQTSASLQELLATVESLLSGNKTSLANIEKAEESLRRIS
ncbi:methyl-accepting chemotaxis protein [Paenibacillus puerhi]|uniref:methyl-accepting chemotaxis protein n=1 Tax=Paenibacillus puerhi TaxID=2692622 RepID=UPI00135A24BD|nr:methyl-accepting chemotaxis protein [Paenibacillus puerhi]